VNFTEAQLRRIYPTVVAVVGALLFLPRLGAFGLWDPYEIRYADAARALLQNGFSFGPQLGRPPLDVWLVAAGFKWLGVGELGGRLPLALIAILALLAVYWAGETLVGRRGAALGALMLATTPAFLLGGRSLISNAPLYLGAALAVGGLFRAAAGDPDSSTGQRIVDLILGILGLVIGQLSAGALVGAVAPMLAVTVALLLFGHTTVGLVGLALVGAAIAKVGWALAHPSGYSDVLGGTPHAFQHTTSLATHLVRIGFQLFPWIALSPMGLIRALDDRRGTPRQQMGGALLVAWIASTFIAGTIQSAAVQDLHLPLGIPLLLLAGSYLDDVLDDPESRLLPFAALAAGLGAIVLGRDFFGAPEQFVGVHLLEPVRWPGPLTHVPYIIMAFAAYWAGTMALGLGAPLAATGAAEGSKVRGRQLLIGAAGLGALAFAFVAAQWIVPQVSKHLSARDIYGHTKMLDPKAQLGQYHFNATGASYYASGRTPVTLGSPKELFEFLAKPERVFVLAGSEELPNIDQFARQQKANYLVIDDSNSRYLVLSNRLGQGESDLNPLKRFISETPPKPQHPVEANFENKVKLLGYDVPAEVSRGQEFKIRLYFQVLAPMGGNYKVFIHFDGAGTRFNGDHVPLEGRFPTPNWVPGYYIIDEHQMAPDRAMQPSGIYHILMGFFAGDTRLKVIEGQQDGENRVRLGELHIK
jgi:4-amino-4-deoxy-L-arabinose transferase-like glycosyltransferase